MATWDPTTYLQFADQRGRPFADLVADSGSVHVMWWDSRKDTCYSATRSVGNCANGALVPSLDVYGTTLNPSTLARPQQRGLQT